MTTLRLSRKRISLSSAKDSRNSEDYKSGATGSLLSHLRKKIRGRSRIGAVGLLILSVALLVLSYRFRTIVLEVNSVVAFVAGLILLFRDVRHTVQSRIVDRILISNAELVQSLSPSLHGVKLSYVPRAPGSSNVVVVPSAEAEGFFRKDSTDYKASVELIPPGSSLAELFHREIDSESSSLDDVLRQASSIISDRFDLASSTIMRKDKENLEFILARPTIAASCSDGGESDRSSRLGCPICSMFATVVCSTAQRETTIEKCERNSQRDILTVKVKMGRSFEEESKSA